MSISLAISKANIGNLSSVGDRELRDAFRKIEYRIENIGKIGKMRKLKGI